VGVLTSIITRRRHSAAISREEECQRFETVHGNRAGDISDAMERQFRTLQNRSQLVLAVCGVLLSANVVILTGKLITQVPDALRLSARLLIVAGSLDIACAALAVTSVLRVGWVSRQPGATVHAWLMSCLAYRDRKTRALHASIGLLLLAMIVYQAAITIALVSL
jgi:hypothetical protein